METSSGGSSVFFDVFGLFMIVYPSWAGIILNIGSIIFTLGTVGWDVYELSRSDQEFWKKAISIITIGLVFAFLSLILAVSLSTFIGFSLGSLGFSLSWYSNTLLLFFLYSFPSIAVFMCILVMSPRYVLRRVGLHTHPNIHQMLLFHSQSLLFAVFCLLLTGMSVDSAFMFSLPLYFNCIWWIIRRICLQTRPFISFIVYNIAQLIPMMMASYVVQLILTIFVPVMGRFGSNSNPDILMGAAVALFTLLLLHFSLTLIFSMDPFYQVLLTFGCLLSFSITLLVVFCSGSGFPYSDNILHPRAQRLSIYHARRTVFRADAQEVVDGGFYIARWDYHWARQLEEQVPAYEDAIKVTEEMCEESFGCGFPFGETGDFWIAGEAPEFAGQETHLTLLEKTVLNDTLIKLTFEYAGPSRISVTAAPREGVEMVSPASDIFHASFLHGEAGGPGTFDIIVSSAQGVDMPLLEITITGHYYSQEDLVGSQFRQFLDQHPGWVTLQAYPVDYRYYNI